MTRQGSMSDGLGLFLRAVERKLKRLKERRKHASAFELLQLEPRLLLSFAPTVSSSPLLDDSGQLTLYLSATGTEQNSIDHWTIDWGDGGGAEQVSGTPSATHPYPAYNPSGNNSYRVAATATVGSSTYGPVGLGLDRSFGTDGKRAEDFPSPGNDLGYGMALQNDGKMVVVGLYNGNDFGVARYNTDGTLDSTFGAGGADGDGVVTTDFGSTTDTAYAVAIQTNGKIVVAGSSGTRFALARYLADGSLDTSFGTGGSGKVTTVFGSCGSCGSCATDTASAYSLVLQPDSKIVAAGRASIASSGSTSLFAVARYNANGTLDTSFDSDGMATVSVGYCCGGCGYNVSAYSVVLQPDGKIVLGGTAIGDGDISSADFALVRLKPDGSLDTSFGGGGRVTTPFTVQGSLPSSTIQSLALQADGRIIAAGSFNGSDFALARYNVNGALDNTFGVVQGGSRTGKLTTDFAGGSDIAYGVAIRNDGRILVVGKAYIGSPGATGDDFALARYKTDGTLDDDFGVGGKLPTAFGTGSDVARTVVLLPDGRAVVAGYSANHFAIARYEPDNKVGWVQAPAGLSASADSSTQVALRWLDAASSEEGYEIARKSASEQVYTVIKTVGADAIDFVDTGLIANTQYSYRVRTFKGSYYSAAATVDIVTPIPPQAPSGLSATAQSGSSIALAWTAGSGTNNGFKIERKSGSGSYVEIGRVSGTATTYTDSSVSPNTQYTYRVRGFNAGGDSGYSQEASRTTPVVPATPGNVQLSPPSPHNLHPVDME